jgi:hypothetical protein
MKLEPSPEGFTIDAVDLGQLLEIEAEAVQGMMRSGEITSRFERGEGEDAGRFRLTFFHGRRRVTLIVGAGEVLQRSRASAAPPPRGGGAASEAGGGDVSRGSRRPSGRRATSSARR